MRLCRSIAALRLRIGEALEVLAARGWHHELGFSSLTAYSMERCERSGRWAADSRALARRLALLPLLRQKLVTGALGWSMVELVARHVTSETEADWVAEACGSTVRQMRARLSAPRAREDDQAHWRSVSLRVEREDVWLFECTRRLAALLGERKTDEFVHALLAEGVSSLLELSARGSIEELVASQALQAIRKSRAAANAAVESEHESWARVPHHAPEPNAASAPQLPDWMVHTDAYASPEALDQRIQGLCAELGSRDLAVGLLAARLRLARAWSELGYASEAQYARERLGLSRSSLVARRALATRSQRLRGLAAALRQGRIGYVAGFMISRIATPQTLGDWIERAGQRTVKHLREEVEAAELFARLEQRREQSPPSESVMRMLAEARHRTSVSLAESARVATRSEFQRGRWAYSAFRSREVEASKRVGSTDQLCQMSVGRRETQSTAAGGFESPAMGDLDANQHEVSFASTRNFGRVALRLRLDVDTYDLWRSFERSFQQNRLRFCSEPISLLRFLCVSFWQTWGVMIDPQHASTHVFARDGFECTTPVCSRTDIQDHHLIFRAHGGSHELENRASLCRWCHLHGVHEGRIAASPPASRVRWRIGRVGVLRVDGRHKLAA